MLACSRMIVRAKRMLLPARRAVASGYSQHLMAARSFVTASPPLLGPHPFPSPAPHADFEPGRFEAENRLKGCKNVIVRVCGGPWAAMLMLVVVVLCTFRPENAKRRMWKRWPKSSGSRTGITLVSGGLWVVLASRCPDTRVVGWLPDKVPST